MPSLHLALLLGGSALLAPGSHAADRTARIDPSAVAGVTLVLTPPSLHTPAPPTQATLPRYGCTFTTAFNAAKHAEMLEILKRHVVEVTEHEAGHFYLRNAVYLRLLDGTTLRYLIGPADGTRQIVHGGSQTAASASYLPFKADARLLRDLRAWAATGTAQQAPSPRCLDRDKFLQMQEAQA